MSNDQMKILFVDDEENVLKSLNRLFRKESYEIFTALSGEEGLKVLNDNPDMATIVSDQRMPKMGGAEFLEKAKDVVPDAQRIILTGYADTKAAIDAINKGGAQKYITKPWDDKNIIFEINDSTERFVLIKENERLSELTKKQNEELADLNQNLEKRVLKQTKEIRENFKGFIRIFADLMELYDPKISGHSKRVALLCVKLAKEMKLGGRRAEVVEIAAYLHNIGLIGIPKELVDRLFDNEELTTKEKAIFQKSGPFGQMLLKHIGSLEEAGAVIRSHNERFDGHGSPDSLKGHKILLGARMLAICKYYDYLATASSLTRKEVIKDVKARKETVFDPKIVDVFIKMIEQLPEDVTYKVVTVDNLKKGMVVSKDLLSESGRMLVVAGTALSTALIEKIQYYEDIDPVVDEINILKRSVLLEND